MPRSSKAGLEVRGGEDSLFLSTPAGLVILRLGTTRVRDLDQLVCWLPENKTAEIDCAALAHQRRSCLVTPETGLDPSIKSAFT